MIAVLALSPIPPLRHEKETNNLHLQKLQATFLRSRSRSAHTVLKEQLPALGERAYAKQFRVIDVFQLSGVA